MCRKSNWLRHWITLLTCVAKSAQPPVRARKRSARSACFQNHSKSSVPVPNRQTVDATIACHATTLISHAKTPSESKPAFASSVTTCPIASSARCVPGAGSGGASRNVSDRELVDNRPRRIKLAHQLTAKTRETICPIDRIAIGAPATHPPRSRLPILSIDIRGKPPAVHRGR